MGNPDIPAKLRPAPSKLPSKRIGAIAATVIVAALLGIVALFALKPRTATEPAVTVTPPVVAPPLRQQSLTYWLTVQKKANETNVGEPFDSAGHEIFGNGWGFRFNFEPAQSGAFYLLNEGPGADNKTEYNVLFPNPKDNQGLAGVAANQPLKTSWNFFNEETGVEKLWLVWASEAPPDLDAVFREAAKHRGVIGDVGQIATLQKYLKQYDKQRLEVIPDKAQKRTLVKGKGDLVVSLVELSHEAY